MSEQVAKISEKPEGKKAGYLFQLQMQVGQQVMASVSGNFPEGASRNEMYRELGKVSDALQALTRRSNVVALKANILDLQKQLTDLYQAQEGHKTKSTSHGDRAKVDGMIKSVQAQIDGNIKMVEALEKDLKDKWGAEDEEFALPHAE